MSRLSPLSRQFREKVFVDPRNPRGVGMCDGCGFWVNYPELREKQEYRGGWSPVGTGLFVCRTCDDVPQPYYRRQVLAPDPVPLLNPRPDPSVTQPINGSATYTTASGLTATAEWINTPFPPASTATILFVTTASQLTQQGWWGGGG